VKRETYLYYQIIKLKNGVVGRGRDEKRGRKAKGRHEQARDERRDEAR
jgi:hypothetical protein